MIGSARLKSQKDITVTDIIRRKRRTRERKSVKRTRCRRWRQRRRQESENVSYTFLFVDPQTLSSSVRQYTLLCLSYCREQSIC